MAYAPDQSGNYQRVATLVDKILRGASPSTLPVEWPMRFHFVINLRTARELGITFPREVLLQVTDAIQ